MKTQKQLPLFPNQPVRPEDITSKTTIQETLSLFALALTKDGKSEHTIKAFLGDMNVLGEFGGLNMAIRDVTTAYLARYLAWMENGRGVSCSEKTYSRRVTTLKVYFKWLHSIGAMRVDVAKPILQRSVSAPLSVVLNEAQVEAVLQASLELKKKNDEIDPRPECILRLLLETGIKKSETERLRLSDIDRLNGQHPQIVVHHTADNVYKERRIEISPILLEAIDRYILQYAPKDRLFTCTTRNLEYIITEIGQLAGIPFKLSFENLRWTMAVRDWRNGATEEFVRDKLGISKISWYETGNKIKQLAERLAQEEI